MEQTEIIVILLALLAAAVIGMLTYLVLQTREQMNTLMQQMPKAQEFHTLSERLLRVDENSRRSFERLARDLGQLSKASEQMMEVGRNITSLEDLLKPPKLRGGIGETLLAQLLAQILPEKHYRLQFPFKGGEIVDAAILIGDRIVPVDSKFPIEQFRRLLDARDEAERRKERRAFLRTVKHHVDAIARKYILPDEGTYDFALMYIPAENIYYETVIKDELGAELFPYSVSRRVIPVSPNSIYAYLQVIIHGLKGMRIEEKARAIMDHLARLQAEENKFREEFNTLGSHLRNARNKYEEAERHLNKFEDKLLSVSAAEQTTSLPPAKEDSE